jgi:hypothetical protein
MLMHPHPSGPVLHLRNIACVDPAAGQSRSALQALAFHLCDSAVFDLLNRPGYRSALPFMESPRGGDRIGCLFCTGTFNMYAALVNIGAWAHTDTD